MNRSRNRHLVTALGVLLTLVLGFGVAGAAPAMADGSTDLVWHATIDGHDVNAADRNDPIPLHAGRDAVVSLTVDNRGTTPITIRSVRLEGKVIGMSFFVFSTRLEFTVPAGSTEQREMTLDLSDLGGQAVGLIPASMALLGPDRTVLGERSLASDVRGSLRSAYGIFGLAVALITLVLILSLAAEIARHTLPPNRWRRAVRYLAPGLGVGLTATFTLSATRVLLPSAGVWVPLVLVCGAVAFILGYLTPAPTDEPADDNPPQHRDDRRVAIGSQFVDLRGDAAAVDSGHDPEPRELP